MPEYDVIIEGGGPAGATAAKYAAQTGLSALILDKAKFPRVKACGGGLPRPIIRELPHLLEYVDSYAAGVTMYSSDLKWVVSLKTQDPAKRAAYVIRSRFDHALLNEAREAGAEVREGERVVDFEVTGDRVVVKTDKGEYDGMAVLGAGGTNSVVARRSGLCPRWPRDQLALVCVVEAEVGSDVLDQYYTPERFAHFHMGFGDTMGYGWVFPKRDHVNVGYGAILSSTSSVKEGMRRYLEYCVDEGIVPDSLKREKWDAAPLPLRGPLRRTYADRVLLLGDAAGFVNPPTGEGIHYAIRSGMMAAATVKSAADAGNFSATKLKQYQDAWVERFGRKLWKNVGVQKQLVGRNNRLLKYACKDPTFRDLMVRRFFATGLRRRTARKIALRYVRDRVLDALGLLR